MLDAKRIIDAFCVISNEYRWAGCILHRGKWTTLILYVRFNEIYVHSFILIANHPYIWNDKEFKEVYNSTELTCNKIIAWCKLTWELSEASCWRGKSGSKKVLKFPLYIKNVWAVMRDYAFNTSVQYSTFFCERQRQVIPPIHIKKIQKLPITYINPLSFCSSPCLNLSRLPLDCCEHEGNQHGVIAYSKWLRGENSQSQ